MGNDHEEVLELMPKNDHKKILEPTQENDDEEVLWSTTGISFKIEKELIEYYKKYGK